jgi:folate-dependent phosphoribosylglycinamide formyltransferase PurN
MKIAILTQEDSFAIPRNIEKIATLPGVQTALICALNVSGALENKKSHFRRGFGIWQTAVMGGYWLAAKSLNILDACCGYRLLGEKKSIRGVARRRKIDFMTIENPNDAAFLERLAAMQLDLIVSLSAPCVFKEPLLRLPRLGCINLHCSLLPHYAGLMPSFWVLYQSEKETGATVHYMDDKIDNGSILGQVRVPIDEGMSVFDLVRRTKAAGGELLVEVIGQLERGTSQTIPNRVEEGSYFTWPSVPQMREFRLRGGRFA